MMTGLRMVRVAVAGVVVLMVAGCERRPMEQSAAANGMAAALPDGLFATSEPPDAINVSDAKHAADEGAEIVIRGRIGGSRQPFVEGRAIFTIADLSMPSCAENPEDACRTPWDYCCEPRDAVAANTATIRVVDDAGAPLRTTLEGAGGLRPLAEVVVRGRVSQKQGDKVLVVDAAAVFVRGG